MDFAELKQKIIKIMYGIYDKKTAETSVSYHLEIVDLQEGPHKGYSKLIASPLCFDNEVAQKLGKEKFEKIRNQSHIEQEYVVGPGLVARKDFALQLAVNENRILSKTKGVNLPMCVE